MLGRTFFFESWLRSQRKSFFCILIVLTLVLPIGSIAWANPSRSDAGWHIETVGDAATRAISAPGLRFMQIDSGGRIHMAYGGAGLYYARQEDAGWRVEVVDADEASGSGASLALDSTDRPVISYCNPTAGALKIARWTGARWDIQWVWQARDCESTVIALDSKDRAHVLYVTRTPRPPLEPQRQVEYARPYGGDWRTETVDIARGGDLMIGSDDLPRIALASGKEALYGVRAGGGWNFETAYVTPPDTGSQSGIEQVSLDLDALDRPAIALVSWWKEMHEDGTKLEYRQRGQGGWESLGAFYGSYASFGIVSLDAEGRPDIYYALDYALLYGQDPAPRILHWTGSGWVNQRAVGPQRRVGTPTFARTPQGARRIGSIVERPGEMAEVLHGVERDGEWSVGRVDMTANVAWQARLARDTAGRLHAAYLSDEGGVYYAISDNGPWVTTELAPAGTAYSYYERPGLAVGPGGEVFVAYQTLDNDLKVADLRDADWTTETVAENLTDLRPRAGLIALALGPGAELHLGFVAKDLTLMHAVRRGGSWMLEEVTRLTGGGSGASLALAVDGVGYPVIAYLTPDPQRTIALARQTGAAWDLQTVGKDGELMEMSLSLDTKGSPVLAYERSGALKVGHLTDEQWIEEEVALPPDVYHTCANLVLNVDATGRSHVAYNFTGCDRERTGEVRYARRMNGAWVSELVAADVSSPLALMFDPKGRLEVYYHQGRLHRAKREAQAFPLWLPILTR